MLANFKKVGVAAAVATVLGVSGAAQAVTLGHPGDALLVPFVVADQATGVNTLIGVTVASPNNLNVGQYADLTVDGHPAVGTLTPGKTATGCNGRLHWYFFDTRSVEVVNDTLPVTCEDFVRIDWGHIVYNPERPLPSAQAQTGYLVIADNSANETTASNMSLYGAAYLIQGNWASQAYIPVLPLVDKVDGTAGDEVEHVGSFLKGVNPVTAGMLLPSAGTGETAQFSLRYFVDPALTGNTRFVLWFPENSTTRNNTTILVYDADERAVSARVSIPDELNVVRIGPNETGDGNIRDGVVHEDATEASAVGPAVNTGFVLFNVRDYSAAVSSVTPVEGSRAGFAFSLIGIGGSDQQVQTELAHERGVR